MHARLVVRGRPSISAVDDAGMERYSADPRDAMRVLAEHTDRLVLVALDLEALALGREEKRQHMAARDGRHEGFFRIDAGGIRPRLRNDGRRRRGRDGHAAIEAPRVLSRVLALAEVLAGALPRDRRAVL